MTARTPDDFDLLSAYLDEALSARQSEALEARLAESAELRAQLDDLRAMRALLRRAPVLQPPRDFRLDPAMYARTAWWSRLGVLRVASAVSAAAAVLLIVFGVLLGNLPSAPAQPVALQATEAPIGTPISLQAADLPTPTLEVVAPAAAPPMIAPFAFTATPDVASEAGLMMATEAPQEMAEMLPRAMPTVAVAEAPPEPTPQAEAADLSAPSAETTLSPLARLAIVIGAVLLIIGGVLFLIATFQRRP